MVFSSRFRIVMTRAFALIALLWERLVPVIFPAALFPALYIALALFGAWERLADPWRLLALTASAGLMVYTLYQGIRGFRWPDRNALDRRLEKDAHLRGRPLELLSDQPTSGQNPKAMALWKEEQARARQKLLRLSPQKPHAALARLDVYGLRAAALLLVFAAAVLAGPAAVPRIEEAFAPRILSQAITTARREAWITGPAYALSAPQFLSDKTDATIEALAGSSFHLKISGARKKPVLKIHTEDKNRRLKMRKSGPQSYSLEVRLDKNSVLTLRQPLSVQWHINTLKDQSPVILFTKVPHGDTSDALAFSYAARDDVGIRAIDLVLERSDGTGNGETTALDLPSMNPTALAEKTSLDFTRHRWAGLPVMVTLIVRDGAGQTSATRRISLTLPDRLFVNPMARAIAEQRALIVRNDQPYAPMPPRPALSLDDVRAQPAFVQDNPAERLLRAPSAIQRSAALMRSSIRAPEMFFEDPLVYVGLRYAAENLRLARRASDYKALDGELWALALWAEGGALADARAALKAAERAFRRALARGAPADELARLMHNYERAVKRYMEALAEEALRNGNIQTADGGLGGMSMNGDELQEMLDALKTLSETGARGDARKLLQALSDFLEKMKMQLAAGSGSGSGDDLASKAMRKALEELGDITAEQRELLDEMFRQQQGSKGNGAPQSGGPGKPGSGLAGEQQGLAGRLRALADGQGEGGREGASGALEDGADEMGKAAGSLRDGDLGGALEAGKDALSALRDGSEALASDLFKYLQQQSENGAGEDRDPFGRPTRGGGSQSADGTKVPDIINAQRAREILQLLRNRAAEQGRTDEELQYLDRLLERF